MILVRGSGRVGSMSQEKLAYRLTMRIDARFDVECAPLTLSGNKLQFVSSVKYLGICITAGKCFKCFMDCVKMKFYRVFNAIYSKCEGINSEIAIVELMKS